MAVRYRGAGDVVGEASWEELAKLVMGGGLGDTAEIWSHESAVAGEAAGSALCCVGDLIDVGDAAEADEEDVEEIAATLQDAFLERCSAEAAGPEPEPESEPAALAGAVSPMAGLSAKQRAAFDEAKAQLPGIADLDVLAYLKSRAWDVQKAVTQCQATQQWRAERRPVSIADIAPFMRTPEGSGVSAILETACDFMGLF